MSPVSRRIVMCVFAAFLSRETCAGRTNHVDIAKHIAQGSDALEDSHKLDVAQKKAATRAQGPGPVSEAQRLTQVFALSTRQIALRGNSEVKLIDYGSAKAVCKVLRYYRNNVDPEKLALFIAEAEMAAMASAAGVGCPVYFWSGLDTFTTLPMIVMQPMEMGCGDAIRAGADPTTVIAGLTRLFADLKASRVFWNDVTSPNNIMTDAKIGSFDGSSRWYFIDFGTSVDTAAKYHRFADRMAADPNLYDEDLGSWWFMLSNWINDGIIRHVDSNRTRPGIDPQSYTAQEMTDGTLFVQLTGAERNNLVNFKTALQAAALWPDWL